MPPFVFADFLATMPTLPALLAFIAVGTVYAWRALERRERAYQEKLESAWLRRESLERARKDAIMRISSAHRKDVA